jgi:hypothetical protein
MSLWHPEKVREFLLYILLMAALVVGVHWFEDGGRVAELPKAAGSLAFVISVFAWWPAIYWLFPSLNRLNENPSFTFRMVVRGSLFLGFLAWFVGLVEANNFLGSATHT